MVLQLAFTHAGSPKAQLALAAKLLPLSSTMPQLLAGCMQVAVAANTWPRVQQVLRWLGGYGCLLNSLALDAVVDCCPWDAGHSYTAVLEAVTEATAKHQVTGWGREQCSSQGNHIYALLRLPAPAHGGRHQ